MVRFRNILVHNYVRLNPSKVYSFIQEHLGDFEIFIKYGKVLYCRDEAERIAFEEKTIDEYLDMNKIEKEYLKCLLQSVG